MYLQFKTDGTSLMHFALTTRSIKEYVRNSSISGTINGPNRKIKFINSLFIADNIGTFTIFQPTAISKIHSSYFQPMLMP
jgi:hypothetical protein